MSNAKQGDPTRVNTDKSIGQNERVRRLILYAAVLLGVFLLGFLPMWTRARAYARERDTAQAALRVSALRNTLASAAINARQGHYESARQDASEFFTNLRTEIDRGRDSAFAEAQRDGLRPLLDPRDDTITLLARSDPASADRLVDLYNTFRQAMGGAPPH